MEELHPNWRALATIHLPLKRFIRAGDTEQNAGRPQAHANYAVDAGSGVDVKKFYDEILEEPSKAPRHIVPCEAAAIKRKNSRRSDEIRKQAFDAKLCYRHAMQNNVAALKNMEFKGNDINTCDVYGWSALMMAACEGAKEAVQFLLQNGANTDINDKSGMTAIDLAKRKGHSSVVELLQQQNSLHAQAALNENATEKQRISSKKPFYCDVCKATFTEATENEHKTSTLHQFNAKPSGYTHTLGKFNIPQRNRGLQLMVKQGWNKDSGLGPAQAGRLYPVKTVIRKQRTGLGVEQDPARVTHFDAYDVRATERNQPFHKTKKRSCNDIKSEKIRDWKRNRRLRNELS